MTYYVVSLISRETLERCSSFLSSLTPQLTIYTYVFVRQKEADNIMQRRLSRIFALALGISLLLGLLAACGSGTTSTTGSSSTSAGSTTIKIATDLPTSGKETANGKPTEDGAHMAIDEANSSNAIPGYKLVLVAGVVGPFNSNVAKAEMPIANQAPIVLISPANTNQCLTQTGAAIGCSGANNLVPTLRPTGKVTYFRIATTDQHQGPANADYLYKTVHYKSAYVVDDAE